MSRVRSAWKFSVEMSLTWPITSAPTRTWASSGKVENIGEHGVDRVGRVLLPVIFGRD